MKQSGISCQLNDGWTIDLSLGGTRIETPYGLISGEKLEISIAIHPQAVKCRGQAGRVLGLSDERLKVGVRFENLSQQARLYLGQYISHEITNSLTSPEDLF